MSTLCGEPTHSTFQYEKSQVANPESYGILGGKILCVWPSPLKQTSTAFSGNISAKNSNLKKSGKYGQVQRTNYNTLGSNFSINSGDVGPPVTGH